MHAAPGRGGCVRVVPTPGRTPGHQSVVVDGGRDPVIVTGDVLVHAVQLVDPDVGYRYEAEPEVARETRRRGSTGLGPVAPCWPPHT
ncbi:MBL fold metallo-hydrolase [Micromonospora sp. B11E3]|uniref:MBL fold metallo-hydrolase n=1 Tax=Micromonospora sp. B11E3 TaxID=3153562 RepID=UPI00325D1F98